jgi:myosin-5
MFVGTTIYIYSMPLSLEEIASSMDAKEFQNVSPPQQLLENAAFQFLRS